MVKKFHNINKNILKAMENKRLEPVYGDDSGAEAAFKDWSWINIWTPFIPILLCNTMDVITHKTQLKILITDHFVMHGIF